MLQRCASTVSMCHGSEVGSYLVRGIKESLLRMCVLNWGLKDDQGVLGEEGRDNIPNRVSRMCKCPVAEGDMV